MKENDAATNKTLPVYPDLKGKIAVVTGASRGIGAETALFLARNGAKIVVNGRDQTAIDSVVQDIESSGGTAIGFAANCTDSAALAKMRKKAETEFGAVEIVVAFAGGLGLPKPTSELDEAGWRKVVDVNLTAKFLTIKTFLPSMVERQKGAVAIMSSTAARHASLSNAAYACAEAGANMLAKHLANEYGKDGIRFNCIMPSAVRSEWLESVMNAEQILELGKTFPLGRIGEPIDVAQATAFLVSDASSWITGITLDIAGGRFIFY